MLEIVIGRGNNLLGQQQLIATFQSSNMSGTLYIGYPIIASGEQMIVIDALLTSLEHGLVIIDFLQPIKTPSPETIRDRQDDLYTALHRKLLEYKPLVRGRKLAVDINVITFAPNVSPMNSDIFIAGPHSIVQEIEKLSPVSNDDLILVNAAIQRIATIKPTTKRTNVTRSDSRGAIMQRIEKEIANLDHWQKRAAIESPDGPQRVRGLAGSGKTIVLALKAAYLHTANPEWDIAVTFNTRALYQQFTDLIRRFCFEHKNDEPDWSKLRIMHAWGSNRQAGIYSVIASVNNLPVRDFLYAKSKFSSDIGFEGICGELLEELRSIEPRQMFDAILIDEAQDLPKSFFELCFLSTREPKRIVWAYDELQNLGSYSMAPPSELFGTRKDGQPNIPNLDSPENTPKKDIVLPVCYRNTPWALTIAHAIGFGIYRAGGLVQFFDDAGLWHDIGYRVHHGSLEPGKTVELKRATDSYPRYFSELLNTDDAVSCVTFQTPVEQAKWVAAQIKTNIEHDELRHTDILIVLPNAVKARNDAALVIDALTTHAIPAHLAGVTASVDRLYQEGSIAISGIYRAKGNEAAVVYILNSEYALRSFPTVRARNALFTAITRSRAWVCLCGVGPEMDIFSNEIKAVKDHDYRLAFKVPTEQELKRLRRIHRDISDSEIARQKDAIKRIEHVLSMAESGELIPEDIPEELRKKLSSLLGPQA